MKTLPFTVLLMMPDYWLDDQPCAADQIVRVWVDAADVDSAVEAAYLKLPSEMPDEEVVADDFRTVAVYPGHMFDLYQA